MQCMTPQQRLQAYQSEVDRCEAALNGCESLPPSSYRTARRAAFLAQRRVAGLALARALDQVHGALL